MIDSSMYWWTDTYTIRRLLHPQIPMPTWKNSNWMNANKHWDCKSSNRSWWNWKRIPFMTSLWSRILSWPYGNVSRAIVQRLYFENPSVSKVVSLSLYIYIYKNWMKVSPSLHKQHTLRLHQIKLAHLQLTTPYCLVCYDYQYHVFCLRWFDCQIQTILHFPNSHLHKLTLFFRDGLHLPSRTRQIYEKMDEWLNHWNVSFIVQNSNSPPTLLTDQKMRKYKQYSWRR